ncbi:MAG: von Willebrand factor, type [Steroidobacteraceae bacterium]|jgi:Ca-activated chloride channel family protein|nr:von Willebrand factor, type [Steroidobacteraceae bacterium]
MKDPGIENFLKNLKAPSPDPAARLRAKRTALAEFERGHAANQEIKLPAEAPGPFQALLKKLRLSREEDSHGSSSMKWYMNRGFLAGAAGLCVVALGLTWVLPNLDPYTRELTQAEMPSASVPSSAAKLPGEESADAAAEAPAEAAARPLEQVAGTSTPAPELKDDAARSSYEARVRDDARLTQELAKARADARQEQEARGAMGNARAPSAPPSPASEADEVVVTGMRAPLRAAMEMKREAVTVIDALEYHEEGRDQFGHFDNNPVQRVSDAPVSTFSADVDTASYSFVRRQLNDGELPEKDAVRSEEMINYFDYAWPAANSRRSPFKPTVVVSDSPWSKGRKLVHIGIKGYDVDRGETPDANLVLLLDVSGSMNAPDKLPLVVRSMELLLDSLKPGDTVGIVVYAGAAGTVLEPTPVREKQKIVQALRSLRPGGSTAGAAGIERAYQLAEAHFRKGGVNRILLCTDGDFNVGVSGTEALKSLVERKRAKGVHLSVLGFGEGNYRDELAQALAQNGNGVAAYIDTENEARKVLVQEAGASLFTIASDVKLQVEFNPVTVSEYRLVGYETRALMTEDFNNDAVDAGDVGAGHTVTAIYEITPVGVEPQSVDEPRYDGNRPENRRENRREKRAPEADGKRDEYGFLKIRYKLPGEQESKLISEPIPLRSGGTSSAVKRDVIFSTAVAGFAQLLRGGIHTGALTYDDVLEQAQSSKGEDRFGYRAEFIELVRKAREAGR